MSFTYNLKQKEPVLLIGLYGDLIDKDECRELVQMISSSCDDKVTRIIIDLSDVRVMNSTGLSILINALTQARKSGGDLYICGVTPRIQKLFIITKLNTIFQVFDSEHDALEKFREAEN